MSSSRQQKHSARGPKTSVQSQKQQVIEAILKLQQGCGKYQQEQKNLEDTIYMQYDQNQNLAQDLESQFIHLQTMNMMSKYQIVYLKLETSLKNWCHWSEAKQRKQKLRRAFELMKERAIIYREAKKCQQKLIVQKVTQTFIKIEGLAKNAQKQRQMEALAKWRYYAILGRQADKMGKVQNRELNQMGQQIQQIDNQYLKTYQQLESQNEKIQNTQEQISELQNEVDDSNITLEKLKNKQQEDIHISEPEIPKAEEVNLESDPVLDQQIQQLKTKIERMELEGRQLNEKIDDTNNSISGYISEMSTMLDSQDLNALINPTMRSINTQGARTGGTSQPGQANDQNMFEGENYDEDNINHLLELDEGEFEPVSAHQIGVNSHAGTGGSSKMRPRPYAGGNRQMGTIDRR